MKKLNLQRHVAASLCTDKPKSLSGVTSLAQRLILLLAVMLMGSNGAWAESISDLDIIKSGTWTAPTSQSNTIDAIRATCYNLDGETSSGKYIYVNKSGTNTNGVQTKLGTGSSDRYIAIKVGQYATTVTITHNSKSERYMAYTDGDANNPVRKKGNVGSTQTVFNLEGSAEGKIYYIGGAKDDNTEGEFTASDLYVSKIVITVESPKTVTFNAGSNGTCSTPSLTEARVGAGVTLPDATPNIGYVFTGWFNSSDIRMGGANDSYTPSANTTLTAHYAATTGTNLGAASGNVEFDSSKSEAVTIASGETYKFTFNNYGRPTYNGSSFPDPWMNWVVKVGTYYFRADGYGWTNNTDGRNETFTGSSLDNYMIALENGAPVEVLVKFTGSQAEITGTTTYKGETFTVSTTKEMSGASVTAYITMQNALLTNYSAKKYEITISAQPQTASYTQFAAATALSVTATAPTGACTYQWQHEKNSDWVNIDKATSATYTPAATSVGSIKYRCVVSAEGLESKNSDEVTITVTGGNSTTSDLTVMASGDVYTPSAAIPLQTLTFNNKIISAAGGNDYRSGYGLNFKDNRYIAFKVPAGATIIVEAGNYGTNGDRTIWLGSSNANNEGKQNLATQTVAQGATGTLTYKYETGGVVYLSAISDLYLKKLTVTNGFKLYIRFNGHSAEDTSYENQIILQDPLTKPTADGYTFVGWYTDPNLTSAAVAGATLTGETNLYAKWTINKGNTVPLNGNGITTTLDHIVVPQSGMSVTLPTAYESAANIDIPANTAEKWTAKDTPTNKRVVYSTFFEAYYNAGVDKGNVLTQRVTDLANGKYEVVLDVAASATNIRDFKTEQTALPTGQDLTQAFAGTASQYIPVINRTAFDPATDYDRVVLVADVTDGTLTYGIKNVAASGNWYVCRVHSIKKIDDSNFTGWNTKADGTGTVYAAGANYSPNYNGTTLYAQWNKTYTFRPVASNGTLTSVTVNGLAVSASNNVDIKVNEGDAIVMTVAPAAGYKFKNWVVTGTAGTENGMTYTISAINADTKLTAKFEALGTATDPNPANGTLSGTTVTINPFPAAYGGKLQDIDLGLPTGATFTVTSGDASVVDGKLRITAPTAPGNASYTINVVAENGTTNNTYTVSVSTVEGSSFSYSVNAVDGSTVLKTIASGDYAEGTGNLTVYYPQHVLIGSKLYELTKGTDANGWYRKVFTPNADNYKVDIAKSAVVENVVYYTEAENLPGFAASTEGNAPIRASMGLVARQGDGRYVHATTLNKGVYTIVARGFSGSNRIATFKANDDVVFTFNFNGTDVIGIKTIIVKEDNTDISVTCSGTASDGLDWFYIQQDLSVLPVTEDGQVEYLSKSNYEAKKYFEGTSLTDRWNDRTEDGIADKFINMKTSQSISINTYGATAFEVFVRGGADRTYNVKVGSATAETYTCTSGNLESSGIIMTGTNTDNVKITISGSSSTVYPVKVKFYTSPMLVGGSTTVTMGKGNAVVDIVPTGGTISMATPTAQAAALVTASFDAETKKLTLTPVKAGTAHLSFTITDGLKSNTVDYVVNVVKQQVTMTYLANKKDTYNASEGAFTSPTLVVKDEAGTDITRSVTSSLIYISDDESLVKYSGTTAQLIPNVIGSAKLKAVLYNDNVYENALATFTVNVSAGIDKKMYYVDGSGKKVGEAVPDINTTLVAKDKNDNVLMTMTYGGYKYGEYTHSGGKVTDSWKGDSGKDTKFKAYNGQGTDIYGQPFDNQIDDYGFQTQAQYDSRDEYNLGIQWFTTDEVKTDGSTHYTQYERVKPFSLPVKGAYLKFEAEVNGTLTAYVLQNGNITFGSTPETKDYPKAGDALGTNPRVYYWFNQDGYRIDPTSFTSKQPLTIGRDYNEDVVTELKVWTDASSELKALLEGEGWPTQSEVNANLQKPVPTPQPVVRYQNGYMVAQKAYVKYVIPVVAGDTYYFFSNNSKVGVAGYNFLPDEDGTVELILPEDGGIHPTIPANTNKGVKALNCTTDVASTHKTSTSIEMWKTVTLPRKFKVNTWSTICLPFHVTEPQVEKVFGKGTNLVIYNGISTDGKARFQKHVNQDILAGQPYLIYPTGTGIDEASDDYIGGTAETVTGLTFTNVNFTPNVAVQSYASNKDGDLGTDGYGTSTGEPSYKFIGTLGQTQVNKYDYYVNNNTGNMTRYTGNGTTLNAYYGYLKNPDQSSAKAISGVSFDEYEDADTDIPTGIMEVLVDMDVEIRPLEGVFNLAGQKVADSTRNLPKGIYIVNGQKVNIK